MHVCGHENITRLDVRWAFERTFIVLYARVGQLLPQFTLRCPPLHPGTWGYGHLLILAVSHVHVTGLG